MAQVEIPDQHQPRAGLVELASRAITWRSLVIALVLMPFCAIWQTYRLGDGILSLLVAPTATTFFVALINLGLLRFTPRWALSAGELGAIYTYLSIGCGIASEWTYPVSVVMSWFTLHGNASNRFYDNIASYLPDWCTIKDPNLLKGYMDGAGIEYFYQLDHFVPWMVKFLPWGGFIFAMAFTMLCINVLMREEWTRRERLSFPILQVPLAIIGAGERRGTLRTKALWIGFAIGFFIDAYIGAARFIPSLPAPNLRNIDMGAWFVNPPLNGLGFTPLSLYPFIIALSFFLPLDLSFSTWFFYLIRRIEQVIAIAYGQPGGVFLGMTAASQPPYLTQQSLGAWTTLFVLFLWLGREHLGHVWENVRRGKPIQEHMPFVSYRLTFILMLVGFGGLLVWSALLQLPLLFMAIYFGLFIALSVAVTRMRAELGPPTHEMAFMTVNTFMLNTVGTSFITERMSAILPTFVFMNRVYRSHPMPHQLEGMKLAEETGSLHWRFFAGMAIMMAAALIIGHWSYVHRDYDMAFATRADWMGGEIMYIINDWRNNPKGANWIAIPFIGLGALITALLALARWRFSWWPFHPAGFALAMNFGVDYFWTAMFIAWLAKKLVLRFGGLRLYKQTLPYMIGVVLGEYACAAIWSWVYIIYKVNTYSFSIN